MKFALRDCGKTIAQFLYESDALRYKARCGFSHFTIHPIEKANS